VGFVQYQEIKHSFLKEKKLNKLFEKLKENILLRKDGNILFNSNLVQVGSLLGNSSWCVASNLHLLAVILLFWNQICFS